MELSEKLSVLRNQNDLTQLDLAEKLNVSRQAISRWESGAAVPGVESLKALSKLYGISVDSLLDDTEDSPKTDEQLLVMPKEQNVVVRSKITVTVLCVFLVLTAIIAGICMTVVSKQEQRQATPMSEMPYKDVNDDPDEIVYFTLE